jgi:hypothetical protein
VEEMIIMVTHIVFFKLKDKSKQSIESVREALLSLKGNVPPLKSIEVGIDVIGSERSYDVALVTKFDSIDDLNAYQAHPFHVNVSNFIGTKREAVACVDYVD